MLKYLNGIFTNKTIPSEKTLSVRLSADDNGQPLLNHIGTIIDEYKRHITCICFIGGENDQRELSECCKIIHKHGLKTALKTSLTEVSQVNRNLTSVLDFISFENGKVYFKDVCPFCDIEDWTEL